MMPAGFQQSGSTHNFKFNAFFLYSKIERTNFYYEPFDLRLHQEGISIQYFEDNIFLAFYVYTNFKTK